MRELDDQANNLRAKIEDGKYRRKIVFDGGKVEDSGETFEAISGKIDEIKKIRNEKREKLDKFKELGDKQKDLDNEKQAILKSVPRNYQNEADLVQAIKEKQTKYETTSLSQNDEKNLLKDIDKLKRALPDMRKLSAIDPELVKIREERKKLRNELDIVTKIIDDKEGKIKDSKEKN